MQQQKASKFTLEHIPPPPGPSGEEIRYMLSDLILHYSSPGDLVSDVYHRVAVNLSNEVGHNPPWTWRYPHQVHRRKLDPGVKFEKALTKLHRKAIKPGPPNTAVTVRMGSMEDKGWVLENLTNDERAEKLLEQRISHE